MIQFNYMLLVWSLWLLTESLDIAVDRSVVMSFHHTEPCPSIIPFPLMVIFVSFVNSIHCRIPEPQANKLVGAIILPSSCTK